MVEFIRLHCHPFYLLRELREREGAVYILPGGNAKKALGPSDHISIMLIQTAAAKPLHRNIRVWPEGAASALQDCFEHTDLNMFKEAATCAQHI